MIDVAKLKDGVAKITEDRIIAYYLSSLKIEVIGDIISIYEMQDNRKGFSNEPRFSFAFDDVKNQQGQSNAVSLVEFWINDNFFF